MEPHSQQNIAHKGRRKPTNKWVAISITSLGTLVTSINSSSINIANPVLATEFAISMQQVQWVSTIYLIIVSSLMLLFGRIGDRIGSHRIYIPGFCIFALGTLLCGLSADLPAWLSGLFASDAPGSAPATGAFSGMQAFGILLLARVIQAFGGSMMLSSSLGLISTIFPLQQRGFAIGVTVTMVGVGHICGPAIGGLILALAPWPMIFFMTLPFSCLAASMAILLLRSPVPPQLDSPPLDLKGAAVLAGLISSAILGLSGGFSGSRWFFIATAVLLPIFILVERKQAQPLFDREVMRIRRFSLGNLVTFLSYTASIIMTFQFPFFLERLWQMPVGAAGLLLTVSAVFMAIAGPISGLLSDRIGGLRVMPVSLGLLIFVLCLLFFLPVEPLLPFMAFCLALNGSGMGLLNTPNNSEIMTAAGKRYASYAGAFVATNRNLAFCLGTAVSAGLFPLFHAAFMQSASYEGAYISALRCLICISMVLMIASFFLCLYLKKEQGKA
ncbi:MAG: MFS transporter [Eggerthellaceae bacterium]|nr:MFS transporter [Eggerthellaceae bacterium]